MNIRTPLVWTGRVVGGLVLLLVVAYGAVHVLSVRRAGASVFVKPHFAPSEDLSDPALVAEGRRIVQIRGCVDCHSESLGGKLFIDNPMIGTVYTANLTTGKGGRASSMTPDDWELAIRHGVRRDGHQLAVMPSEEFAGLTDHDVAAIVAYAKSLPPVDGERPAPSLGPMGRLLFVTGEIDAYPASRMHQVTTHPRSIVPEVTPEFGRYVTQSCAGCHGQGFSGGKVPGTPPDFPPAGNITPDEATGIGRWSEADFIRALREGVRPDGTKLAEFMPVQLTKHLTDTELKAAYAFLRTVPAKPKGNR